MLMAQINEDLPTMTKMIMIQLGHIKEDNLASNRDTHY